MCMMIAYLCFGHLSEICKVRVCDAWLYVSIISLIVYDS